MWLLSRGNFALEQLGQNAAGQEVRLVSEDTPLRDTRDRDTGRPQQRNNLSFYFTNVAQIGVRGIAVKGKWCLK